MKALILSLVLVLSSVANAGTLAQLSKGVNTQDGYKVINAYVQEDGTLDVNLTDLFATQDIALVSQGTIHPRNLTKIKNLVVRLANAEIVESTASIVCKIAVSPEQYTNHLSVARDYDYSADQFNGQLTAIHGPQGCWVVDRLALEKSYQNTLAAELKSIIEILAVEVLGNQIN